MTHLEYVTNLMADLGNPERPISTLADYFCADYVQKVDGKTLNLDDFLNHASALRSQLQSAKVRFIEHLEQPGKLATLHEVEALKTDGSRARLQVYAFWHFSHDGRLRTVNEVSRVLEGSQSDSQLASVR
ncbi:hypothetical protein [Gallaecimonas mangrovi]|uniref:hypothetical protein n=1 Tax=Gallaecimonas mangrovi TaxID=2291597 RepID=UPI000E202BD8|nr:hypothetical protein [Gallaecimonas mangrovi]